MAPTGRSLGELAAAVGGTLHGAGDVTVDDVFHDSRQVRTGGLYVALRGEASDGHDFAEQAVDAGAVAICVERELAAGVPQLVVADTRLELGPLASAVHGNPSAVIDVVGVTGTNGKTTVTHYVESLARRSGRNPGLIGTIATRIADVSVPATMTTPEASDFQRLLADMRSKGADLIAAEVSSHALEFHRVRGTRFAVGAFTNLTQDHLDFHGDMESYRLAKERLFFEYELGCSVINVDDPVGAELARKVAGDLVRVGAGGDVSVTPVATTATGTRVELRAPDGAVRLEVPVLGAFNLSNLAIAVAICLSVDIAFDAIGDALPDLDQVPGRFERVTTPDDDLTVIVDYAHTPEGVRQAVASGRELGDGRLIGLVGAGGDRDRYKRPAMGAALSGADLAVITSDNPRHEDPAAIAEAVSSGVAPGTESVIELDRRRAIEMAIRLAQPGDVVLLLGRGHEPHQQIGDERIEFDDRVVAGEAMAARRKSANSGGESGSMAQ